MSPGILACSETSEGAFELLTKGREVSKALGIELAAVVFGKADSDCQPYFEYGAQKAILVAQDSVGRLDAETYANVLFEISKESGPDILLLRSTRLGKETAGRVAQKLQAGCITDAIGLEMKGVDTGLRAGGELDGGAALHRVQPELTLGIEQQMLRIGRPEVSRDMVAEDTLFLALVLDTAGRRGKHGKLAFADQEFPLAACSVHEPELAILAFVVALDEGKLGVIRAPLEVLGGASGDAAFGEDRLNGKGFLGRLGRRGLGHCERKQNREDQQETSNSLHEMTPMHEKILNRRKR